MRPFTNIFALIAIIIITGCSSGDPVVPPDTPQTEKMIWSYRLGPNISTDSGAIAILQDDSTVVTGTFWMPTIFGGGEPNETILDAYWAKQNIFIARYNPDGTLAWAKEAGGPENDYGSGITVLADNSILLTGYFESPAVFGKGEPNETELVFTDEDEKSIFLARYNSNGLLDWAKKVSSPVYRGEMQLISLPDNSTVMTGYFSDNITFGENEPNETELSSSFNAGIFIARHDTDGMLLGVTQINGNAGFSISDITVLTDGSIALTGYFRDAILFGKGEPGATTLVSLGKDDIFIAKYHPDGTLTWAKQVGGTGYDLGNGITGLSDNSFVLTGSLSGAVIFGEGEPNQKTIPSYNTDMFVARYNPDGTLAWVRQVAGADSVSGERITTLSDNSIVVAGVFEDSATFDICGTNRIKLYKRGRYNLLIAKYYPDGSLAWVEQAGVTDDVWLNDIAALSDDSTVLTCHFEKSISFYSGDTGYATRFSMVNETFLITRFAP